MTFFQDLDKYLKQDFSDDYWSDDAKFYACNIIYKMKLTDWEILLDVWKTRSKQWQIRCAEILSWAPPEQGIPLLLKMIQTPDYELTLTAADSLNSTEFTKQDFLINTEIIKSLQRLSKKSTIAKIIANKLLSKFDN